MSVHTPRSATAPSIAEPSSAAPRSARRFRRVGDLPTSPPTLSGPLSEPPSPSYNSRSPADLHRQLVLERHQRHDSKVFAICHCEAQAILNYALRVHKLYRVPDFAVSRDCRRLHWQFRQGKFTPPVDCDIAAAVTPTPTLHTPLAPLHSLEAGDYLHFQSDSLLTDLSSVFGVKLSESKLEDPNPMFARILQILQEDMQPFLSGYRPCNKIEFPFVVCIVGPIGSGKTTVCQFMEKVFDLHVIDCTFVPADKKNLRGNKGETQTRPLPPGPPPLACAIQLRYSDDKSCVAQIVEAIKSRLSAGKGFLISGYPTQRNQFASLEKALTAAGANMIQSQLKFLPVKSPRAQAQLPSINGIIFTLACDQHPTVKLVDPRTGCVYKRGFCVPGIADMLGVKPIMFLDASQQIFNALEDIPIPETTPLPPKQQQQLSTFEQSIRKSLPVGSIRTCDSIHQVLALLDTFVVSLFKKNMNYLPNSQPLATLVRPTGLVRPGHCFMGISTWYRCLELFGRTIADQSNLLSTLPTKLDVLIRAATDRYQLMVARRDERIRLCSLNHPDPSGHFREIWEQSIAVRNRNIEGVDGVIDKSGLIELLLELRTSAKIVFIALVHRLLHIKWFAEHFAYLVAGEPLNPESFTFFETLDPGEQEAIPEFGYQRSSPPVAADDVHNVVADRPVRPPDMPSQAFRRGAGGETRGFEYLLENMKVDSHKPADAIYFNAASACADLGVPPFAAYGVGFDDTMRYADAFFGHLAGNFSDALLVGEVQSAKIIYKKFTDLCSRKESSIVNVVFDVRDALIKYAYAKCTHEMELFSVRFRLSKTGEDAGPPFEYDVNSVNLRIRHLAALFVGFDPVVDCQSLIGTTTVFALARECQKAGLSCANDEQFMDAARRAIANQEERNRVELCVRVLECVECFNVQKFLVSLARTHEEQSAIAKIMENKARSAGSITFAGRLSLLAALAAEEEPSRLATMLTREEDDPPDQSGE